MSYDINIIEVEIETSGKKKTIFLEEVNNSDKTPLRNFYIVNAMGNYVWIKTIDRTVAQLAVDTYYGKGFYTVKSIRGAKGGESVTCRAVATRKGQYKQAQRAKVLNS